MSDEMSAEGGGATTDGAGRLTLELRFEARSGADTGGGTTVVFVICTGALENSRRTPPGAGGITFADKVGLERVRSAFTVGAGATTEGFRRIADDRRSPDTLGAGAMIVGASRGAINA